MNPQINLFQHKSSGSSTKSYNIFQFNGSLNSQAILVKTTLHFFQLESLLEQRGNQLDITCLTDKLK